MRTRARGAIAAAVALVAAVGGARVARGGEDLPLALAELSVRPARIEQSGGNVVMSASFPDLFDGELAARLDSGFAMTVVVRAYLLRQGAARAEALAVRSVRVAWDLWDEVYLVEERDQAGTRRARLRTRKEAIARVTTLDRLALGELAWMPPGERWEVAVLVEVNPLSPETLAQVRRWLTRPQGGHRIGEGESLFGSLVSIFVNPHLGDAEKVLRFRVAPFGREGLPPARERAAESPPRRPGPATTPPPPPPASPASGTHGAGGAP